MKIVGLTDDERPNCSSSRVSWIIQLRARFNMAHITQIRSGRWQITITNKLLAKGRAWFTFDTESEAEAYGSQAEKWLAAGLVPEELKGDEPHDRSGLLGPVIREWSNSGDPSATDLEILGRLFVEVGGARFNEFDYTWCERWVRKLKLETNLSPGSIRKRVQALSRAIDWHLRRQPAAMVGNPLHLLPKGYSTYNERDAAQAVAMGGEAKTDVERDRRLAPDEEAAIRLSLSGAKRPDRERALDRDDHFTALFEVILGTGMRLREAYRLRVGQVDLVGKVLRPQVSKSWRGRVKYRNIPLHPRIHGVLERHLESRSGAGDDDLVFDLWDGTTEDLKPATGRLSARFATLFRYSSLDDLTEHDLRHEATCRWFEMRGADGHWLYRTEEINSIMGWAPGSTMALRYASFRAEDLASRMWPSPAVA